MDEEAMTPAEAPNVERVIADLDKLRLRLIDRGEYVTNEWADVADASVIGEAIEALRELLAVREGGWTPVSEQTPPFKPCLLWWVPITPNKYAECVVVGQRAQYNDKEQPAPFDEVWYWANGRCYAAHHVTHWMPLPTPPRKETT